MALIGNDTTCSICDVRLEDDDEIVAFDHFLGDKHPLWRFSDSAMHKTCFESWPHRDEFLELERVASDLVERIPEHLSGSEVSEWFHREAGRLGLGY